MNFSEKNLVKAFKIRLEKQKYILIDQGYKGKSYETNFKVYLNKTVPTQTRKFKRFWRERNFEEKDIPPPQPEIDMILVDDFNTMRAVEIKVVRNTKRGVVPSYYIGLGQAFAYLSFGFPQVALWLCFDGNDLDDAKIYEYNDAFSKIRAPIRSFLDFTYYKILGKGEKLSIQTGLYNRKNNTRWWGSRTRNGKFIMSWVSVNPFLRPFYSSDGKPIVILPEIRKQVETIYEFLKIQKRNVWDK